MKSLRVAVTFDEESMAPDHRRLCSSPALDRQYILGGNVRDDAETTISYVEGDSERYEALIEGTDHPGTYEITESEDGFFLYTRQPLGESGTTLFEAFHQETIVVVPPFEFRPDRTMRMTVVGASDDLQALLDGLPDGVGTEILRVGDHAGSPLGDLSSRQREAVAVAWECGYYEVPRDGGIEIVAGELECAISTASDLLRRAESRLVANALDVQR